MSKKLVCMHDPASRSTRVVLIRNKPNFRHHLKIDISHCDASDLEALFTVVIDHKFDSLADAIMS